MDAEAETQRRALQQAFGDSFSDTEGDDVDDRNALPCSDALFSEQDNERFRWESVGGLEGLWICRDFLSEMLQSTLLSSIEREGWFAEDFHNQAMRFGDLPEWAIELARLVRHASCFGDVSTKDGNGSIGEDCFREEPCPLPSDLLWREPLFDQLIVNVYKPGEGICAHVDLMRFEDGIAVISLESDCVMHFSRSAEGGGDAAEGRGGEGGSCTRIPVFLSAGSLILMSGEARYLWKHEINRRPGCQLWGGREIRQRRRTSVTLRKLCPSSGHS